MVRIPHASAVRLLASSAWQHLVDDPALLVVQISRRMPPVARRRFGAVLRQAGESAAPLRGLGALGAVMAGDAEAAQRLVNAAAPSSRLAGETAILLGLPERVSADAAAATRARAAWALGDLSGAVSILEEAGQGHTAYARRLRSELELLEPTTVLDLPSRPDCAPPPRADGEALRVLHVVTNSLPHTQSGYSLRTHRILRALADQGVESLAVTRTGYPLLVGKVTARDDDVIDGIRYHRTLPRRLGRTPRERLQQEAEEVLHLVGEWRPHILHTTTDYRNAIVTQAVSRATGIPWVFEVRGLMEQTWAASQPTPAARDAAAASEKTRRVAAREGQFARDAHAVVTLSETMAQELATRGVSRDHITLVPNGVEDALFAETRTPQQARTDLGESLPDTFHDALLVGAVSALVDYEGFEVLLDAVALLINDAKYPQDVRDRLRVVLVGDGAALPGLAHRARQLGIADRVLLPGRVPSAEARVWVQALDVVVVPRLDREVTRLVTPQKPVEALALGRPVIASDLPALEEVLRGLPAEMTTLVSPGEPRELTRVLAPVVSHPPSEELVSDGRGRIRAYSWMQLVRRYSDVYAWAAAGAAQQEDQA